MRKRGSRSRACKANGAAIAAPLLRRRTGDSGGLAEHHDLDLDDDVADALNRIDFKVVKSQVRMPNGPLKTVGEHTVTVAPHGDVVVEVKVVVLGETT